MDRLDQRLDDARSALATLNDVVGRPKPGEIERDAAIKRFEYTFETLWKAAKLVLEREGIEADSPRAVIRGCLAAAVIDGATAEALLKSIADRNLSVHTYKRSLAAELYERLESHAGFFAAWLAALERRSAEQRRPLT